MLSRARIIFNPQNLRPFTPLRASIIVTSNNVVPHVTFATSLKKVSTAKKTKKNDAKVPASKRASPLKLPSMFEKMKKAQETNQSPTCCDTIDKAVLKNHRKCASVLLVQERIDLPLLHVAATVSPELKDRKKFNLDMLRDLLKEKDNDILKTDQKGCPPLHFAVVHGTVEAVQMFHKAGASLDAPDEDGMRPISLLLQNADEHEKMSILRYLTQNGVSPYSLDPSTGNSLLHEAVMMGSSKEMIEFILNFPLDVNITNLKGQTALHLACELGEDHIIEALFTSGAKIDTVDKLNATALHYAISTTGLKSVPKPEELREGEEEEEIDDSPMEYRQLMKEKAPSKDWIAKYLIQRGASMNIKTQFGDTVLHVAASEGKAEIVKAILETERGRALLEQSDNEGYTPLLCSIDRRSLRVMQMLVRAGASVQPFKLKDGSMCNPLTACLKYNFPEGSVELMQNGAPIDTAIMEREDPPLHMAVASGRLNLVQVFIESSTVTEMEQMMIDKGADVEQRNYMGRTALDVAIELGHREIRSLLRAAGCVSVYDGLTDADDQMRDAMDKDERRREELMREFKKGNVTQEEIDAKQDELDEEAQMFADSYDLYGIHPPSQEQMEKAIEGTNRQFTSQDQLRGVENQGESEVNVEEGKKGRQ
ncbi:putative ankyrin repeat-containing protein [Planoprotostelium fungivorum]|uniref:Putative ankyrin repeat-containing protein n=1 Tax=Planoprotostelium fungivorum TaxID=1890364 RepID=A0A2P6NU84_9EUKA|nr:putative ankyrin repeat-containing protein [Planoprotostelium fungivorum]